MPARRAGHTANLMGVEYKNEVKALTSEELNTQLYEKISAEQNKYRDWLLT